MAIWLWAGLINLHEYMTAPYQIYSASAGSGKTFALAQSYLALILEDERPLAFKHILALTFTNKAVGEMKKRILQALYDFGHQPKGSTDLFDAVQKTLDIDPGLLRARARKRGKELLHHFAFFDISTIDKFNHRILRTFGQDLKLPPNFEVVLDTAQLVAQGVDSLMDQIGIDPELTEILVEYALEKMDGNTSWDPSQNLRSVGMMLFEELHGSGMNAVQKADPKTLHALKKKLREDWVKSAESRVQKAKKLLDQMAQKGIEHTSFTRSSLPKWLAEIARDGVEKIKEAQWLDNFDSADPYNKKTDPNQKDLIDAWKQELTEAVQELVKTRYDIELAKNKYKNLLPLSVIRAISEAINQLCADRQWLPIGQFNQLIAREIQGQPAPFIYERLGDRYHHFFIDEFQDTSVLQWENLVPLIDHTLQKEGWSDEAGSLLLVGDPKQSIYRWRGGDVNQLIDLSQQKNNPFTPKPVLESLNTNYRSSGTIVGVNNELFPLISQHLSHAPYRALYEKDVVQKIHSQKQGWVSFRFIDTKEAEDAPEAFLSEGLSCIEHAVSLGYDYGDICVLTRNNKQAIATAKLLNEQGIPVVSAESLLVSQHPDVRFLIGLLRWSLTPENQLLAFELAAHLALQRPETPHEFLRFASKHPQKALKEGWNWSASSFLSRSIFDAMHYSIERFGLGDHQPAYLIFFMDYVHEWTLSNGTNHTQFLSDWEIKKDRLSIQAPEHANAVQVMTIHKAKGLEFPIVVYNFVNDPLVKDQDAKLWIPVDPRDHWGMEQLLISKNKVLSQAEPAISEVWAADNAQKELDAFNTLYVAMTRPVQGLYLIAEKAINQDGAPAEQKIAGLIIRYLQHKNIWHEANHDQLVGSYVPKTKADNTPTSEIKPIDYCASPTKSSAAYVPHPKWSKDSGQQKAQELGQLFHEFMQDYDRTFDLKAVEAQWAQQQKHTEPYALSEMAQWVIDHPKLKNLYGPNAVAKNECTLWVPNGDAGATPAVSMRQSQEVLRPDRLVFGPDHRVWVLDYKTGMPKPEHTQQITRYARALGHMGYTLEEALIIYVQPGSIDVVSVHNTPTDELDI